MVDESGREIVFDPKEILENVRPTPTIDTGLTPEEKQKKIAGHFAEIMKTLGLDLTNDSLRNSPDRVARMYVNEMFEGLHDDAFPKITVIENEMHYDQMVLIRDIKTISTCEHHFVTIDGQADVAYIPNKRVIGLSKINRIVRYFSRRPQVQERLTKQVADCLCHILDTQDVAVHIKAKHYCVISRGVEDINSETITTDVRGVFRSNAQTRSEFFAQINTK